MTKKQKREREATRGLGRKGLIYEHEGLLEYAKQRSPFAEAGDLRHVGWNLGRQIVAQHMIEVALKTELAKYRPAVPNTHDFEYLFKALPNRRQKKAEKLYGQMLESQVEETWDVFQTVEKSLRFLGSRPTVDTRYYWEGSGHQSNELGLADGFSLFSPENHLNLAYALMIAFHDYPTEPMIKRYDTRFISLQLSIERDRPSEG